MNKTYNTIKCFNKKCNQKLRFEFREAKGRIVCSKCKKAYNVINGGVLIDNDSKFNELVDNRFKINFSQKKKRFLLSVLAIVALVCIAFSIHLLIKPDEKELYLQLNKSLFNNLKNQEYDKFYEQFSGKSINDIELLFEANLYYNSESEIKKFKDLISSIEFVDFRQSALFTYKDYQGKTQEIIIYYMPEDDGSYKIQIDESQIFK